MRTGDNVEEILFGVGIVMILIGLIWLRERLVAWFWNKVWGFLGGVVGSGYMFCLVASASWILGAAWITTNFSSWLLAFCAGLFVLVLSLFVWSMTLPNREFDDEPVVVFPQGFWWALVLIMGTAFGYWFVGWLDHVTATPENQRLDLLVKVMMALSIGLGVTIGALLMVFGFRHAARQRQNQMEEDARWAAGPTEEEGADSRLIDEPRERRWSDPAPNPWADPDADPPTDPAVVAPPPTVSTSTPIPPPRAERRIPMDDHEEPPRRAPVAWVEAEERDDAEEEHQALGWDWSKIGMVAGLVGLLVVSVGLGYCWASGSGPWAKSETEHRVEWAAEQDRLYTLRLTLQEVVDSTDVTAVHEACDSGWSEACGKALLAAKLALPACAAKMDKACWAASLRFYRFGLEQAAEAEQVPTSWEEARLTDTRSGLVQEAVFASRNKPRIAILVQNPDLSREVILRHWNLEATPWDLLSHPALTPADVSKLWGEVQANGQQEEGLKYLLINPHIDPALVDAWVQAPAATPLQREWNILFGLHLSTVPAKTSETLVVQAIKDVKELSHWELWNVLVKAGENGDLSPAALKSMKKEWETKGSPLTAAVVDWDKLGGQCSYEFTAGRHSPTTIKRDANVVPQLDRLLPPNLPDLTASAPSEE